MDYLIGKTLTECEVELKQKGIKYLVQVNNHNVDGDTELVTNVTICKDNTVVLTVGEFIFNLKD